MKKEPVKTLVFDVRRNPGGTSIQGSRMIRNIYMQPYLGATYVITDRSTFSSVILNTLELQSLLKATIFGEQTAGRPNHYGEIRSYKLPNSGAVVTSSTRHLQNVKGDPPTIFPDIEFEQSFDQYMKGIDPAWEYITNL